MGIAGLSIPMTAPAPSWKVAAAAPSRSLCCTRERPCSAWSLPRCAPDRGPDLIAWADGGQITRNGKAVAIDLSTREFAADDVVFLNHGAWQRPVWNCNRLRPRAVHAAAIDRLSPRPGRGGGWHRDGDACGRSTRTTSPPAMRCWPPRAGSCWPRTVCPSPTTNTATAGRRPVSAVRRRRSRLCGRARGGAVRSRRGQPG